MSDLRLVRIGSKDELRRQAAAWDDLWLRGEAALPTLRAELTAQWFEQFAPRARFTAIAIEQDGQLAAALPLVGQRVKRVLPVGGLPSNAWSTSGDLLLDTACDCDAVLDRLVAGLGRLAWPLYWFDHVDYTSPRWKAFLAAMERAGWTHALEPQEQVGLVDLDQQWTAYEASWSGNHRRHMRKAAAKLDRDGLTELKVYSRFEPGQVQALVKTCFEVEDRSWKGPAGTSVLKTPGMFDFFLRQAQQLAAWGQLELSILEHQGQPISFEFGYLAKDVYFAPKVGYDDQYSSYSPGQVLLYRMLKGFMDGGHPKLVDFAGPLQAWTGKWTTRAYPLGRLAVAPPKPLSRLLLQGYIALRRNRAGAESPVGEEAAEEARDSREATGQQSHADAEKVPASAGMTA